MDLILIVMTRIFASKYMGIYESFLQKNAELYTFKNILYPMILSNLQ